MGRSSPLMPRRDECAYTTTSIWGWLWCVYILVPSPHTPLTRVRQVQALALNLREATQELIKAIRGRSSTGAANGPRPTGSAFLPSVREVSLQNTTGGRGNRAGGVCFGEGIYIPCFCLCMHLAVSLITCRSDDADPSHCFSLQVTESLQNASPATLADVIISHLNVPLQGE